ncbi:MAG: class I SAM-dependent methyltransferase [Alphaproteobacteria bacterium]|nr:class I SAM-dependent methyltransferase [Alphaproteobacteria bacterium]
MPTAAVVNGDGGDRFAFGQNWQSFVGTVTTEIVAEAEQGLLRLFPGGEIAGSRFLDIGSGSGLSAVAAGRLGAARVDAIDVDPASVAASEALLTKFAPDAAWSVRCRSVLDLGDDGAGAYDIVYSWGVLHHTGAMWDALERAAAMVAPGGWLAVAFYRRTPFCGMWRFEKRCYSHGGTWLQAAIRGVYKAFFCAGLVATGRNPRRYVAGYKSARGMDWHHDVHDWLGGYPYESTEPAEVIARLHALGFDPLRVFEHSAAALGLFGSHCDEYVARRRSG